nr:T9SS type A sorting domain-containing protein [Bacteroidota bacterium]
MTHYWPGATVDITFTITCLGAWNSSSIRAAFLDFPEGVMVNSSTDFVGGSDGSLLTSNSTGNGVEVWWTDENGGFGNIKYGESAIATVNITVGTGFYGNMELFWTLMGDIPIGGDPDFIYGIITKLQNPWLSVNPGSGNCAVGETESLTVDFSAVNYLEGEYAANIVISSNDPDKPEVIVPVILNVISPPEIDHFPGTALEFDGTDDHVIITSVPELRPSNNFTIEAWIKPDDIITNQVVFMHDENGGGDDGYALSISNGKANFSAHNGASQYIISDEPIIAGTWNHIAGVFDNSTLKVYVNGVEKTLAGSGDIFYSLYDYVNIGRRGGSYHPNTSMFSGTIEEVRFWDMARTQEEIAENMHINLLGYESGLLSYWQFNDGSGTVLTDVVSGNDGDLINMDDSDWIESTIPFGPGVSETQTETAGTVDFTGTGLSMFFNNQNGAEITVTRIDTVPNIIPITPEAVFHSQYWVVNRFGSGTFDADLTFTVSEDLTVEDENNPARIKLYSRGSTADTGWTLSDNAMSVNAANNTASFTGFTGFSQFILARDSKLYHTIDLPQGWSGLSSYLIPADTDIENIFDDIPEQLVIALTEEEIYYPANNINTIGNWEQHAAYKVKTNAVVSLSIAGFMENNHTLQLLEGWNLIPVISSCPVDVEVLFAPVVSDLEIVKEIAGWGIYWPGMGINNLGTLNPGKAYYVLVMGDVEVTFEECMKGQNLPGFTGNRPGQNLLGLIPWELPLTSPSNHSIAILSEAVEEFETSCIIGAFDQSGICFGITQIYEGTNYLAVFGDDVFSAEKDGFVEGERISFRLFNPITNEQFDLTPQFDQSQPDINGTFTENGISAITGFGFVVGTDARPCVSTPNPNKISIYPNPTTGLFTITGIDENGKISILNLQGRQVMCKDTQPCDYTAPYISINLSGKPPGIYMLKICTDGQTIYKKLILH